MNDDEIQTVIDDATFDYTMGDTEAAVGKLEQLLSLHPESFGGWHALAEIHFQARRFDDALSAAEQAHQLREDDLFINTSLSRIWMEKGDKTKAEHFGARARVLGWKEQLQNPSGTAEEEK